VEKVAAAVGGNSSAPDSARTFPYWRQSIAPSEFTRGAFDTLNWFIGEGMFRYDGPSYLGARTSGWKRMGGSAPN
jgi:hypothetical protein